MKVDESSSKFFSWGLFLNSVFCFDVVLYLNYWFNHALVEIKAVEKFCDWIMWKRMFVTRIWVGIVEVVTQKFEQVTEAHFTGRFHKESMWKYTFIADVMAEVFWKVRSVHFFDATLEMPTVKWFTTLYLSFDCYPIQYVNRKVLLP